MNILLFNQLFFSGTMQEAMEIFKEFLLSDQAHIVGAINAYLITECRKSILLSDFYKHRCDLVTVDGRALVYLSIIFSSKAFPEMIGGPHFWEKILEFGAKNKKSFFFWGSTDHILEKARKRLTNKYPELIVSGMHNGYCDITTAEFDTVLKEIRKKRPDIIFIGMPSPKKEEVALRIKRQVGQSNIVLIGGAFDYFAGKKKICNDIISKLCLEWVFRMIQEPFRLGPRYLKSNIELVLIVIKSLIGRKRSIHKTDHKLK